MTADSREIAYRVLLEYEKTGSFIGDILEVNLRKNQFEEKKLRAFVSRISEGVVERKLTLDFIIKKFSKTPFQKIKPEILTLLRMGIYQIIYMDSVPESAAVNESVKLAKSHGFGSLTGYINAVLRAVIKAGEENRLKGMIGSSNEVRYSTPDWICRLITGCYGKEEGKLILEAQFEDRPTAIRVNNSKVSKEELRAALAEAGATVEEGRLAEKSLRISGYDFIRKLPGFREGWFSVQDESSAYAVEQLWKHFRKRVGKAGRRMDEGKFTVLDLCAAPGGKSLYTAELLGEEGQVISRDISVDKTDLIRENAERLGLDNIITEERDASMFDEEMAGKADIVIADVPCSGLGVMGHKNDIKYNITEEGARELAELGLRIISNAVRYIKPGGVMMFSTCTINPAENGDVLRKLFSLEAGSKLEGELMLNLSDEPGSDVSTLDELGSDVSALDEPGSDVIALDEPGLDVSALDEPGSDVSALDEPGSDVIALDEPGSDVSALDEPKSDVIASDAPATDAPATLRFRVLEEKQLLQSSHVCDGFYYAILERV